MAHSVCFSNPSESEAWLYVVGRVITKYLITTAQAVWHGSIFMQKEFRSADKPKHVWDQYDTFF